TLAARGRLGEAETAFKKAIAAASDSLVAEVDLAELRFDRGERDEAMKGFGRLIDAYNRNRLDSEQLTAVGTACRYLGADDPQLFKDALKAYDEAIDADADNLDARVRLAELFLDKYNGPDADATVKEALERNPSHPRALLARARVLDFNGQPGVVETIRKSLAVDPALVEAHVLLAEVFLEQEDLDAAAREAEAALGGRRGRGGTSLRGRCPPCRRWPGRGSSRAIRPASTRRASARWSSPLATPSCTTDWRRSARATACSRRPWPSRSRRWRWT